MLDRAVIVGQWALMSYGVRTYHDERGNYPVDYDTESDLNPDFSFPEDMMKTFVLDFTQDGIHHNKKSNSYFKSANSSRH